MKPIANLHRTSRYRFVARQPQVKNVFLNRIRKITSEIHTIQAEMHGELNEPASGNKLARFFEEDKAVQVINDFKAELDQLRRILWFYIEHGSAQPNAATDSEQYDKPLQRMNELLRTLAPKSATSATAGEEVKPSVSFFERLDVVIDTYMRGKKPVAQAKTAKAGY